MYNKNLIWWKREKSEENQRASINKDAIHLIFNSKRLYLNFLSDYQSIKVIDRYWLRLSLRDAPLCVIKSGHKADKNIKVYLMYRTDQHVP